MRATGRLFLLILYTAIPVMRVSIVHVELHYFLLLVMLWKLKFMTQRVPFFILVPTAIRWLSLGHTRWALQHIKAND